MIYNSVALGSSAVTFLLFNYHVKERRVVSLFIWCVKVISLIFCAYKSDHITAVGLRSQRTEHRVLEQEN